MKKMSISHRLMPVRPPTEKRTHNRVSIFLEIKKEHQVFRKEMSRIRKHYEKDCDAAKGSFMEFKVKLHAHTEAEERSLYGYLFGKTSVGEKMDDQLREGIEEHHLANLLLNELTQIPAVDPKWKAKYRVLQESVEHHLDEEEERFPSWKRTLSKVEDSLVLAHFITQRENHLKQPQAMHH